jgi:hypothetical protein
MFYSFYQLFRVVYLFSDKWALWLIKNLKNVEIYQNFIDLYLCVSLVKELKIFGVT